MWPFTKSRAVREWDNTLKNLHDAVESLRARYPGISDAAWEKYKEESSSIFYVPPHLRGKKHVVIGGELFEVDVESTP